MDGKTLCTDLWPQQTGRAKPVICPWKIKISISAEDLCNDFNFSSRKKLFLFTKNVFEIANVRKKGITTGAGNNPRNTTWII